MRLRLLAIPLILTLALAACSGDSNDDDDATPSSRETPSATRGSGDSDASDLREHEDELRETVPDAITAIFAGGGVDAYSYASKDFKEKCALDDFIGLIAFVKIFLGEIEEEDIVVTVTDIRYEDDRAFATAKVTIDGEELDDGTGSDDGEGDLGDYWVYEDGEWKWGTDDDEPCDTSFDSGGDDEATPATGPGSSRAEPLPFGESADAGDLRVTVLEADLDASPDGGILDLYDLFKTPVAGNRNVALRVRAEHIGTSGDETIDVSESSFKLTGSGNVLYNTFENGCGFFDDAINGELFPGGATEGVVCFDIPSGERDLLLVVDPNFGFDASERRYLALE